jgi:hypothetical protein
MNLELKIPRLFEGKAVGRFAIIALVVVVVCRFSLAALLASLSVWVAARLL